MALKVSNNAVSVLAASISASDVNISLSPGTGVLFPSLSAGDWFPATLIKSTGEIEIVKVTGRSADVLTVTRAQESTAARAFNAGERIEHRLTAAAITSILTDKYDKTGGTVSGDMTVTGSLAAGSLIIAGATPWTSANFNPSSKLNLSGGTLTGNLSTVAVASAMATSDSNAPFQVQAPDGTGDANLAAMSFLVQNKYGLKMGLRADGYFGIGGWSAATWRWYLNNATGDMVAAGNVAAYSDPRLKDDVSRISGALAIVEQLDGVRFTWNRKSGLVGRPGERDIGVLADQVEAVLPEAVSLSMPDEGNDGQQWRVVAYAKLVPVLIEAVKDLAEELRNLKRGS